MEAFSEVFLAGELSLVFLSDFSDFSGFCLLSSDRLSLERHRIQLSRCLLAIARVVGHIPTRTFELYRRG